MCGKVYWFKEFYSLYTTVVAVAVPTVGVVVQAVEGKILEAMLDIEVKGE